MIPKRIHQTWKTKDVPSKWLGFVEKVKSLNPDWEYKLWTDEDNEAFVKSEFPDFFKIYMGLSKNIMRADVIRYLIMYRLGGVYLDLDYEMLKPFDFGEEPIVLPLNRSKAYGDTRDELGNCIFASEAKHPFWKDVIDDMLQNPPTVHDYRDVIHATGPGLLTRIYYEKNHMNLCTPERMLYHPPSPNRKASVDAIKNNGISVGIHHPWGSWKERWTWAYWKVKFKKK